MPGHVNYHMKMKYPLHLFVSYSAVCSTCHTAVRINTYSKKYLCDNQGSHYEIVDFDYTKETIMPNHWT